MSKINFNYDVNLEQAVSEIPITQPSVLATKLNINKSVFPQDVDNLKSLVYTTPDSEVNTSLKRYYEYMFKIYSGKTLTDTEKLNLNTDLARIKDYIQTPDKLNLLVNSINNLQKYCKDYLLAENSDLDKRYQEMNNQLRDYIEALNEFMSEVQELLYTNGSELSLPDGSILPEHFGGEMQTFIEDSIDYINDTMGVVILSTPDNILPLGNAVGGYMWIRPLEKEEN